MNNKVRLACESDVVLLPLNKLLPMRMLDSGVRKSPKFKCIEASIRELGLIEPLVVYRQPKSDGSYMILDGHVRLAILKEIGEPAAKCLIATDDEGFTYNHKLSRPSPIQEHFMILRAIKNGLSESRIARALNLDLAHIRQKRDMLEGICAEAVQLLKDRRATAQVFRELRKVKPMRQIELAEVMCLSNNFTVGYTKCLVAATPAELMLDDERPKDLRGLSPADVARMEHEMESLGREYKLIEESHGKNVFNLVLVVGYLKKLLDNNRVVRFLSQNHPEVMAEFQKLIDTKQLREAN